MLDRHAAKHTQRENREQTIGKHIRAIKQPKIEFDNVLGDGGNRRREKLKPMFSNANGHKFPNVASLLMMMMPMPST